MRLTLTHASAVSGRLGGVIGSNDKLGSRLAAHTPRTQPRSPGQTNHRADLASLVMAWRSIPEQARASWASLADQVTRARAYNAGQTLTGYSLYLSCNLNLGTLNLPALTCAPAAAQKLPPIEHLAIVPVYSQPTGLQYLNGLLIDTGPWLVPGFWAVARATPGLSPGKGNIRASDMRVIAAYQTSPAYAFDSYAGWVAAWGAPLPQGRITVAVNLVDPTSGFAGPAVRAQVSYVTAIAPAPIAGTVEVLFNDESEATLQNTVISFGGVPEAGG